MPNKCNYCKQIKKCRKRIDGYSVYCISFDIWDWVCQDCDDYLKYQQKEFEKEVELNMSKEVKKFIEKRDKVLKKIHKIKGAKE